MNGDDAALLVFAAFIVCFAYGLGKVVMRELLVCDECGEEFKSGKNSCPNCGSEQVYAVLTGEQKEK